MTASSLIALFQFLAAFLPLDRPLWPALLHRSCCIVPDHSSVLHKALACRWKRVYSRIRKLLYMPEWLRNALLPHSRTGSNTPDYRMSALSGLGCSERPYCKPHVKMLTCIYFGGFCVFQRQSLKEICFEKKSTEKKRLHVLYLSSFNNHACSGP